MLNKIFRLGLFCTLLMTFCCGCSMEGEIAKEVKEDIIKYFRNNSDLKGVSVNSLTVTHRSGDKYDGRLGVTVKGRSLTLDVDITYEEGFFYNEFQWEISESEMQKIAEILYPEDYSYSGW